MPALDNSQYNTDEETDFIGCSYWTARKPKSLRFQNRLSKTFGRPALFSEFQAS